jgi:tellurite resistance protein TehA-like permease
MHFPHTKVAVDDERHTHTTSSAQPSCEGAPPSHWHFFQALQLALSRVPAEAGGISLNLAGMASWLAAITELHPALAPAVAVGAWVFIAFSCSILAVVVLQAIFHNAHVRAELNKHNKCGSFGALCMSCTLCCSYLRHSPGGMPAAYVVVLIASALQLIMLVWFLFLANRSRAPPVPYWFPATVGVATAAIAGSKVGMHSDLQLFFFALAATLCLVEWPWITMRLAFSDRITPAPSIFVHAAPVSIVSIAYIEVFVAPAQRDVGYSAIATCHFFFASSTAAALTTLIFAYRRRSFLRRFVLARKLAFVHQEWSAPTFPLVTTSTYAALYVPPPPALCFCNNLNMYASRIAPLSSNEDAIAGARGWATALAVFTFTVVAFIDIMYLACGLPQWVCSGLPPVPAPPPLAATFVGTVGDKHCCKCWPPCAGNVQPEDCVPPHDAR